MPDRQRMVGRRRRLADIDGVEQIVGLFGARLVLGIGEFAGQIGFDIGELAGDFGGGRGHAHGSIDGAASIGNRSAPVAFERHDGQRRQPGRAVRLVLLDAGQQEFAPCPRALLQPPVDDQHRQRVEHQPLRIGDSIGHPRPWAQPRQIGDHRLRRFDDDACDRLRRIGLSEIGLPRAGAGGRPIAEMTGYRLLEQRRFEIAGNGNHHAVGPIPALVKGADTGRVGGLQCRFGADGRPFAEQLSGEYMLAAGGLEAEFGTVELAAFGDDDRPFGRNRRIGQHRFADHAREILHTLHHRLRRSIGDVELIGGRCRTRRGVAVAAETDTEPLPCASCLAAWQIARFAEGEMLDQMRPACLLGPFHQRPGIDAQADRHLPRRHPVAANSEAQAVVERTELPARIGRNVAALIEPGGAVDIDGGRCWCSNARGLLLSKQRLWRGREERGDGQACEALPQEGGDHRRSHRGCFFRLAERHDAR